MAQHLAVCLLIVCSCRKLYRETEDGGVGAERTRLSPQGFHRERVKIVCGTCKENMPELSE